MAGGGGSSNTNTVTQNNIPGEFSPLSQAYADSVLYRFNNGLPEYTGQRYANTNPYQQQAIDMTAARAANGSPVTQSAQSQATGTLSGDYLNKTFGNNPYQGLLSGGTNPYAGSNPYLENAIQKGSNDIIRNYQTGTAAQLDKAAAQANAFGNSGYQQAVGNNQRVLGDTLGNYQNAMRMQDYATQQQLAESGLNRGLQAQTANATLADSALNRNASLYNSERDRQIRGLLVAPQIAQADYNDANMLGVAGNQLQQYQQANLQNQYQQWYDTYRAPLQTSFDLASSAINTGRGLGSNSTSQSPYASNMAGNLIGGGLLGYQAYNLASNAGLFGGPAATAITYGAPAGYTAAASDAALAAAAQAGLVML